MVKEVIAQQIQHAIVKLNRNSFLCYDKFVPNIRQGNHA